jgi:hypothetical protein
MRNPGLERWAPWTGTLFVVLYVVGELLVKLPAGGDSHQEVSRWYADDGNRAQAVVGLVLWGIAGASFLLFLGVLWSRLRRAQAELGRLAAVVLGSGLVFVTLFFAAAAAVGTMVGTYSSGDESQVGADLGRFGQLAVWLLFVYGLVAAAVMVASTSLVVFEARVFPRWFGWFGLVCAVALLFGFVWFTQLALILWVPLVSFFLFRYAEIETTSLQRRHA